MFVLQWASHMAAARRWCDGGEPRHISANPLGNVSAHQKPSRLEEAMGKTANSQPDQKEDSGQAPGHYGGDGLR